MVISQTMKMIAVSSWGRLSADPHKVTHLLSPQHSISQIQQTTLPGIAYGMGRSYGDVCLNPSGSLWNTQAMDDFISFDEKTGILRCEAGVLLRDIQRIFIPRGWCLAVTPGTQFVSIGGAIANDVHGKNHHVTGSFGNHLLNITLARTDGKIIHCTPDSNSDWLQATIGGLGLTGIILEATIQLRRVDGPWLQMETIAYRGIDEFFELSDNSEKDWEYTVSWIDCLSGGNLRGIFMRANHSALNHKDVPRKNSLAIPITPPISLVNKLSLRPFNFLYHQSQKRQVGQSISHYQPFFYPLDNIQQWNRIYGPKGFYQYQLVVPRINADKTIQQILQLVSQVGQGSFLTVLKTFGCKESLGMLSFPQAGVTLALDFPNKGQKTLRLFEQLDKVVLDAGGRIYPAKDARMSAAMFKAGYERLDEFKQYIDPGISSGFSRRVMGH